jgi:YegS/Rv2252/BmrU family lipid kinase
VLVPELPVAAGPYAGRTFIIINPAAGQEDTAKLRRLIGGAFAARSAAFDLETTQYAGHAAELALRSAELGYRGVCVVGGDGTLAEAATGLAGTDTPLSIIPRGTGNQVAHNLGIPIELEGAVDVAVNGIPTPIDLGRVNGRAFALVAGAGFDAAIMATATRELKERWGFGAYIYAAVKEALSATPRHFHIQADGKEFDVEAVTVMMANVGALFAAFLPFSPIKVPIVPRPMDAWQDGLLDVVILAPRKLPEFAAILLRAAQRKFTLDERLIHFQAAEITVTADPPIAVQIDGDPAGVTPLAAAAVRNAMRVMVPDRR